MGKKGGPHQSQGSADGERLQEGEALLEQRRFREAYQCFLEATQTMPTKQLAWFNLGIAASELWEAEGWIDIEMQHASKPGLKSFLMPSGRIAFDTGAGEEELPLGAEGSCLFCRGG